MFLGIRFSVISIVNLMLHSNDKHAHSTQVTTITKRNGITITLQQLYMCEYANHKIHATANYFNKTHHTSTKIQILL